MKRLLLPAIFLAFLSGTAYADLYQWSDERGRLHITDSMEKVPSKYRGEVKVFKGGPSESPAPEEGVDGAQTDSGTAPAVEGEQPDEIYGEETLEWWIQSLQKKSSEISELQASVATKTSFVELFESGRRFGQIYDSKDVAKYEAFKKELPVELKELSALKEEYEDLQGKAVRAGVPKEIREQ